MLKHRVLVAEFLNSNYEHFFKKYGELLQTRNYATLRQSLKLLSELLLGRDNFSVLQKYISDEQNLKVSIQVTWYDFEPKEMWDWCPAHLYERAVSRA